MNIFNQFLEKLHQIITMKYGSGIDMQSISMEYPRDKTHGDLSTNAAMILTKQLKKAPKDIALEIVDELKKHPDIVKCEIAGAGFINIFLESSFWANLVGNVLESGEEYGKLNIGGGKKIGLEFVSANPTGPMHIGHSRGAIYGDALASLLEFTGFKVTREFYINDYGGQIEILGESVFIRYKEVLGENVTMPDEYYPGEYLVEVGKKLKDKFGDKLLLADEVERKDVIKQFAVKAMMGLIKDDLKLLGVEHDIFTSERFDIIEKNKNEEAFELLKSKGLIYRGILEAPKGKTPDDWEPREQELFKSTEFGDDIDRALKKSNGSFTYFATDIAYHLDKIQRGFDELILLLGADHAGYIKRIKAVVSALSDGKINLDVKINQLVNLLKNGEPFKMSKRAGKFITVQDMVEEVGKDILRFVMLSRKADTVLDLDFAKAKEQSKENPVFYVQYAHTRACSVLRKAAEANIKVEQVDYSHLKDRGEINLIKQIMLFPKIIEASALAHEPHRITFYLCELANEFHSLWSRGVEDDKLRVIIADNMELTKARLALIIAAKNTLAIGLGILKISALEQM
ncbi:arginine--tRNA ligase [Candidatus Jidaibacter acanthamoebae]|nr:arginine--tRNA ligase [Candidatus Jidaibacter acanthamoeba]